MSDATDDDGVEEMKVRRVAGTGVPIRGDDIDTDQIIPARFLKTTTWEGMDEYAFYDARRDDDGELNDHPFNEYKGANVLVVNDNFGCGSSREHAPRALARWGVEAIVGESFAEIFADNCKSLGIPAATADPETVAELQDVIEATPEAGIELDVVDKQVTYGNETVDVSIDEAMHGALVQGIWDTVALLRSNMDAIDGTATDLPYVESR
ncbi:3-isopropylmalate dehydratase small subunit [Haloplanus sp.]|uniref:3-isopropylmalate dehydratase small subunit n=1 Tax=Haloplanus sp. TaxID=1961696 RepID=UPI0026203039|nr:3-isopropylmalate dehydratase small subunit [Haloplanus sp.]